MARCSQHSHCHQALGQLCQKHPLYTSTCALPVSQTWDVGFLLPGQQPCEASHLGLAKWGVVSSPLPVGADLHFLPQAFQRQIHERLTQLELINKQYRRLARENRTDTASKLKKMVHEGNQRWDNLQKRVTAILRRLRVTCLRPPGVLWQIVSERLICDMLWVGWQHGSR